MKLVADSAIERLACDILRLREEYEFRTFWLGSSVRGPVTPQEAIDLRRELNRRVGERVEALATDLLATPDGTDLRIDMQYPDGGLSLRVASLMLYGRYRKLSREIPQSRWPCRWCWGAGCPQCGGTGKRYAVTIEEIVAAPLLTLTGAEGSKLHSVGREDVDALMLGRGRPFILELTRPRRRTVDLAAVIEQVNRENPDKVEVREFQRVDESLLEKLCSVNPDKSYRALVRCLVPAPREAVARLASLRHVELVQETPRRVLHRRPNLTRRRQVRECAVEFPDFAPEVAQFELTLRVESGTYIKEFISGDEGRTNPSVSRLIGIPCECAELDVVEVHCDPLRDTV